LTLEQVELWLSNGRNGSSRILRKSFVVMKIMKSGKGFGCWVEKPLKSVLLQPVFQASHREGVACPIVEVFDGPLLICEQ
jgi:hypothetical protein